MRWLVCLGVILAGCGVVKAPSGAGTDVLKGIGTIHAAEVQYYSSYGRFAASLQELGPPTSGADTAPAGLIEHDLASGAKGGYHYALSATPAGYALSATPDQPGVNTRSYFSDQSMRIHVHAGPGTASADDPTLGD